MVLASMNALSVLASGRKLHGSDPEKRLTCFCNQSRISKVREQEKRCGWLQAFWNRLVWSTPKDDSAQTYDTEHRFR
ncbi:hypothetical protein AAVH_15523 [Aphelenchoides avenae]|nr:hypothetical protein AAVH_15523 [Aphelenchus avenae]